MWHGVVAIGVLQWWGGGACGSGGAVVHAAVVERWCMLQGTDVQRGQASTMLSLRVHALPLSHSQAMWLPAAAGAEATLSPLLIPPASTPPSSPHFPYPFSPPRSSSPHLLLQAMALAAAEAGHIRLHGDKPTTAEAAVRRVARETGRPMEHQILDMLAMQTQREYNAMCGRDVRLQKDPLAIRMDKKQCKRGELQCSAVSRASAVSSGAVR
ncbi:unnamed protein product [Closterium sp. NIES-54]